MQLKLQVSNELRQKLGAHAEHVFDHRGGTIGRAAHNDWVLPDTNRYVSSVHASIEARDGGFYLVDTSMNGVYINGSKDPLGPTQPYKLTFGTRLRMGSFRMVVSEIKTELDEDQQTMLRSDLFEDHAAIEPSAELSVELLVEDEMADKIDLEELLDDRMASANMSMVTNSPFEEIAGAALDTSPADSMDEFADSTQPHTATVHRLPGARRSADVTNERRDVSTYRAMLRGLGLDPATLEARAADEIAYAVGKALRTALESSKAMRTERARAKQRLGISQTQQDVDDLTPTDITDDIADLLLGRGQLYPHPADNVRDQFRRLQHHGSAVQEAAEAAFKEVIALLEPTALRERLEALGAGKGMFTAAKKANLWDHFCQYVEALGQSSAGELPPFIREEFARAYAARLQTITSTDQ
ncbi:MAG: type VI secretion system-associated FHA domain protein TagH [Pseudomonadota bacterium]